MMLAAVAIISQQTATQTGYVPVISDTFTRSDSSTLGNTETGQAWSEVLGDWQIVDGEAALIGATAPAMLTFDSGISDNYILVGDMTTGTTTTISTGLVFRGTTNPLYLYLSIVGSPTNQIQLRKRSGTGNGTAATMQFESFSWAANTTYRIAVAVIDDDIQIYVDGVFMLYEILDSTEMSTYGALTGVGLWGNGAGDSGTTWSNIEVHDITEMPTVIADSESAVLMYPTNPTNSSIVSQSGIREHDDVAYDPNDPNLGTNPERLYKLYWTSPDVAGPRVSYSADGTTWETPQAVTTDGVGANTLREDISICTLLSSPGEVYRDGDGRMWAAAESDDNNIRAAYSTDGITWTMIGSIIASVGSSWEETIVGSPVLRWDGSQFLLIYEGGSGVTAGTGLAYGASLASLTKSANNPIWIAANDPGLDGTLIVDAWFINEAGDKYIFLAHADLGENTMFRGSTTNMTPTSWTDGDIRVIKREREPFVDRTYTVDYSQPGTYLTNTVARDGIIRVQLVAIP